MDIEERMQALAATRRSVIREMAAITDMRSDFLSLASQGLGIEKQAKICSDTAEYFLADLVTLLVVTENEIRPLHTRCIKEM